MEATFDASKYFAGGKSQSASSLIPSVFRENYEAISKFKNDISKESDSPTNLRPEKFLFQASFEDRISFYKNLVRASFAEKKSVFIALPTEYDVSVMSEVLSKGIENFTFPLKNSFSPKKLIKIYGEIVSMDHPVLVLGTAPFLSIPRHDWGAIIVEKESNPAYKMQSRPYIDMRTFAEIFASKIGAKFILGDSLLRFESLSKKGTMGWSEAQPLSFRTDWNGDIYISDKYEEKDGKKKFRVLSDETLEKIKETLKAGKNVFIFSLRKGLATYTICKDCSTPLLCEKCSSPVVLYLSKDGKKRMFSCNRCKAEKDPNTKCENCGSWNLLPLGIGTETVMEELKKVFGGKKRKILKLDKESAKTAKGAEKIIKEFEESSGSILVGTELALFYLKEKTSLSVIASFDSLWTIPNFRMSEKILRILFSILSKTKDTLCIETRNGEDPAILALKRDSLLQFAREELKDREFLSYPPFKRFVKITHSGNKNETLKAKKILLETFKDYNPDIFSGFVPRVKNKYITNALIKLDVDNWSLPEILPNSHIDQNLLVLLLSLPPSFAINVDPEDLL